MRALTYQTPLLLLVLVFVYTFLIVFNVFIVRLGVYGATLSPLDTLLVYLDLHTFYKSIHNHFPNEPKQTETNNLPNGQIKLLHIELSQCGLSLCWFWFLSSCFFLRHTQHLCLSLFVSISNRFSVNSDGAEVEVE